MKMPPGKTWLWFMLILLANFFFVRILMPGEAPVTVPYTLFKEEVRKGNVEAIYSRGETITGRFTAPVTYPPAGGQHASPGKDSQSSGHARGAAPRGGPRRQRVPSRPRCPPSSTRVGSVSDRNQVEISAKPIQEGGSPWATLFFGFGPALLFIGFYVWMFRRAAQQGGGMGGGLMGIGRSRARRYDQEQDTKVTFDDVAGIDEAENELVEIVDFLEGSPEVHPPGRDRAERRAAGGRAGYRENPAGEGGRGRGGGAVLLDERCGIRGDDRGGGRGAGAGPFQAGARARARRSSSSTSWTPSVARGGRWRSGARASRSRP